MKEYKFNRPINLGKAYEAYRYKLSGGKIHCGHREFKEAGAGDVVFCDRCGQFFVVANALPWLIVEGVTAVKENHLADRFLFPIDPRVTSK